MKIIKNRLKIRSKNHSAKLLDRLECDKLSVLRLGSKTPNDVVFANSKRYKKGEIPFEINTVEACVNSSNKRLMKQCFNELDVATALWCDLSEFIEGEAEFSYPIVVKGIYGYKNKDNYFIKSKEELDEWLKIDRKIENYIVEKFYTYSKEYRVHVAKAGAEYNAFYSLRKMLVNDIPDEDRWFRNDANCVWILEDNEQFDAPVNWDSIKEQACKAIESVGLSIGCVDVKTQSRKGECGCIILETNSAPSLSEITAEKYNEQLKLMLNV